MVWDLESSNPTPSDSVALLWLQLTRRERFKREFLAYKAARDRQINERIRANTAATRIQSWWRMTMVRKGLGPYKRIAKKKKKKKK